MEAKILEDIPVPEKLQDSFVQQKVQAVAQTEPEAEINLQKQQEAF